MELPGKRFAILEGREASGGTWDLFRYPGVRSDSDMYTLGYRFKPWRDGKAIADGPAILNYIRETAREYDLEKEIRYGHRVRRAEWNSAEATWRVEVEVVRHGDAENGRKGEEETWGEREGETRRRGDASTPTNWPSAERGGSDVAYFTCSFLYLCTGYYRYEEGYTPEWAGFGDYEGTVVHPQKWPAGLDYSGKRVLVIGSGATAVTLVPAMAATAAHVTMLQRSPTYVVSMPSEDRIANAFRAVLPAKAAYAATRWKNVLRQMFFYGLAKKRPSAMKRLIEKGVRAELGEEYLEHFRPTYNPWDQRLCLVPDSDLFAAIREGKASVVTGTIETFTKTGVRLAGGREIEADIVVTATGLILKLMDGLTVVVDGKPVVHSEKIAYKGMMYNDVPNLAQAFGYTNASWTLKCDLTSEYVCRLIKHMDEHGFRSCTPRLNDETITREPALDFNSGYVLRALGEIPSQGSKHPWRLHQNYAKDLRMLRYGRLEDGTMEFK
ncbi:MAG: NAD(P)/FAD-dependent oxidoreductase [Acidobacteria bacterium]|nr:NAD(P)/FAD-dependent oxidoreductase [Acidobacteriota bacterium]